MIRMFFVTYKSIQKAIEMIRTFLGTHDYEHFLLFRQNGEMLLQLLMAPKQFSWHSTMVMLLLTNIMCAELKLICVGVNLV